MQIDFYVLDGGKLRPVRTDFEIEVIPRVGETISFGTRQAQAKVHDIEYLVSEGEGEVLVGVILDREP